MAGSLPPGPGADPLGTIIKPPTRADRDLIRKRRTDQMDIDKNHLDYANDNGFIRGHVYEDGGVVMENELLLEVYEGTNRRVVLLPNGGIVVRLSPNPDPALPS
jgi:hypothetical protein